MAGLDDLRTRVEAAERQFGLNAEQSKKYSERLTGLMSQMEQAHSEQQREIAALSGQLGQVEHENGQLKSMLLGTLQAIENGSETVIDHAVRDLEGRIGRLVGADQTGETEESAADPQPVEITQSADPAPQADDDDGIVIATELADDTDGQIDADDADPVAEGDVEFDVAATTGDDIDAADPTAADIVDLVTEAELASDGAEPDAPETVEQAEPPVAMDLDTVTLDDEPEANDVSSDSKVDTVISDSASELLDRVEAAANALLTAGVEDNPTEDDGSLNDEIASLLSDAISSEEEIDGEQDVVSAQGDGDGDAASMADDEEELMLVDADSSGPADAEEDEVRSAA